jgi:LmbE family N-acetylglucosaminyl deacetylase
VFDLAPGRRLQVVVAHPDDETFGCGSLLLYAAAAGCPTAVVCATRGEAGEVAAGVEVPPGGVGALREAELRAAAAILGVGRVDVLGFRDSGMSGEAPAGSLAAADVEAVRAAVAEAVRAYAPDLLVTLDGSDGHRDHGRVRDTTVQVAGELGVPVLLHCLARSVMRRWAEHMAHVDPENSYLGLGELGTPDEAVGVVLDTSPYLETRWRAIRAHRSQRSPFEGLPKDLADAFLCREHLAPATDRARG